MAFDSRDVMISLPSAGEGVGYQLTCRPLSPQAPPPDEKGKPKPPCPAPSCQNSTRGPKPPLKPGPKKRTAAGLLALRQQLRQTLSREQ